MPGRGMGSDILSQVTEAKGKSLKRPWNSFAKAVTQRLLADVSEVLERVNAKVTRCEIDSMDPEAKQGFDPRILPPFFVVAQFDTKEDPAVQDSNIAVELRKKGWGRVQVKRWGKSLTWTVEAEIPRN